MRILILTLVSLLLVSSAGLFADDSNSEVIKIDQKQYPVKVSCTSEDREAKREGRASIRIQIDGLQKGWVFTKVELNKAVDDTDKDLIKDKVKELDGDWGLFEQKNPSFSFWLKQSNRDAKVIKEIQGTLHLQNSGTGKSVVLPDFKKNGGEYIKNDELEKQGIRIAYINKETFDKKGSKIIMSAILPKNIDPDNPAIKNSVAQMKVSCTQPNIITLVVEDPEQKILKIEAMDPKTKKTKKSIKSIKKIVMIPVSTYGNPKEGKPNFSHLKIFLKDKQLTQKVPFKFKNIKLP